MRHALESISCKFQISEFRALRNSLSQDISNQFWGQIMLWIQIIIARGISQLRALRLELSLAEQG